MRIGRALIIPAVLALSVAGSALVGAALPAAAANVPIVHANTHGLTTGTNTFYHGAFFILLMPRESPGHG
jgi:hypothetical protein